MPDFDFFGGEIVHYPLSNGVDEVSEQFFLPKRVLARVWCNGTTAVRCFFLEQNQSAKLLEEGAY